MTAPSRPAIASTDPRVQAAWREYVEAVDRGEAIEVERFLAGHPAAADELRSLIAFDEEARRLVGGGSPKPGSPPALPATPFPNRPKAGVSTQSVVAQVVETSTGKRKPTSGEQAAGKSLNGPNDAGLSVPSAPAFASLVKHKVAAPPPVSTPITRSAADLPESFGRYRVQKKLGFGAMGAVYLAEDTLLQRDVALKTPTFEDDADGELLKRFYREARAVSKLKHQNLCGVYDVGEIDGWHYISMEFVPGKKLQEFIKPDKPMTEKQAMAVVRKIALAMHEAHAHGVIHRDLKPDNIMVNEKGEPVVMDFGLVHKTDQQNSTRITQRGTLIGSPAYMSKEQVEGDPDKLTGATDQYSLGVVLYQLLTSKLPFEGGIHAVLGAILTREPPPPSEYRPDLNPHLEAVCLKMMAKEVQDRYPSMKAAADALAAVARGTSTMAGSSLVARPKGGSASEALLETSLDVAPANGASDEFDFKSPNEPPAPRKVRRGRASRPPRGILIGGLSAGLVLLAAIIWIVFGDQRVKVEILADGYEVKFNEAEITITDGTRETKVKPGDHTLHIKSSKPGDDGATEEFDTEQLTLKKGGKPVVSVSIENGEAVAKLDGAPIARRSFVSKSSTGESKPEPIAAVAPTTNPATPAVKPPTRKSDYDAIATGKWVPLVDATTPLPDPTRMKFTDDILELKGTLRLENVSARNVIVRAKIIKVSGNNCALGVRDAKLYHGYAGYFGGGNVFGIGKVGKAPWSDFFYKTVGPIRNSFFEMAVSMVEDTITIYADGKTIGSARDTEHERGAVALSANSGVCLFKDVEVMILDKPTIVVPPPISPPKLTAISELNTSGDDTAAWVSADGRRIYWQQNLAANDDAKIWQAERASATEPFGKKMLIADGEQPTLTPDELQMVFIRRDAARNKRLYTASRKAISDRFGTEVELKQFGNFNSPFISADGLSLFVNARSTSRSAITDAVYNVARRKNLADAWPPMVPFNIEWDAVAQKVPLSWIAMEPDELSFLATHELDVGQFRVLRFTRSRKTEPFEKYEYLSLPGMPVVYGRSPRYVAATRELFLTAPANYASANSLMEWRAGNHELWVIRNVNLSPTTTTAGSSTSTSRKPATVMLTP